MEFLKKVLSKENLNNAYKQVCKNKGASGADGVTVEELFLYIKEHCKSQYKNVGKVENKNVGLM